MAETRQPTAAGPAPAAFRDPSLSPDERTLALLAHMLQIMLWWIAPLAIFFIKRKSKFISFHALQALLLQIVYVLLLLGEFMLGVAVFFLVAAAAPSSSHAPPPPAFFILMPVLWLSWMGMGLTVLLAAIVYGVKAGRGEWAEYPVLGPLALKILKLRPGGAPL
jgi:uncharacterized membrane protein